MCTSTTTTDPLGAETTDRRPLQIEIDAEGEVDAGLAFPAIQYAHRSADGVDLQLHSAGRSTEWDIVALFDARLAYPEIGKIEQWISSCLASETAATYPKTGASTSPYRYCRVKPSSTLMPGRFTDSTSTRATSSQLRSLRMMTGMNRRCRSMSLENALAIAFVQRDERAQRVQRQSDALRAFHNDKNLIYLPIVGERAAQPVQNTTAPRRDQAQRDAILIR